MASLRFCANALFLGILVTGLPKAHAQADPAPAASPGTPASSSATPSTTAPAARRQTAYRRNTLDARVKQLAKSLDLDQQQQAGVKTVLERQQLQARQIQFDPKISGEERIGRFRALQDDTVLRIRALLNDEQKKKYDPLAHEKQEAGSSDKYVDQWMKTHQRTGPTAPAEKKNSAASPQN